VAGIGVGGKGAGDVKDVAAAGGNFIALCDVDEGRALAMQKNFPEARIYKDFRVMFEKEPDIDAVTVSTADHTHAVAALAAMQRGKHVYCQKPLTHSVYEARVLAEAADYYKVQTQMGNQAHAGEAIRRAVELIRAGIIGPVREVHAWTDRPIWPQGQRALDERTRLASQPQPANLEWDLWLGPAPERPYNACFAPFKWRGWWDFGTGALGDMACHIMDMPYWALDLGAPTSVVAEAGGATTETGPDWSTITYQFAARSSVGGGKRGGSVGPVAKVAQPAVKFVWYDGKRDDKQNAPYDLLARASEEARKSEPAEADPADGKKKKKPLDSPGRWDLIMVGDDGMMLFNRGSTDWIVTPNRRVADFAAVEKSLPRPANEDVEWVQACRGGSKALSAFDYSGPFTEMVILGTVAVRLGKQLTWDSANLRVTNAPEAEALIRRQYRAGWDFALPKEASKRLG
jgi:predicted dehydrogenase